ncbi:unnamed protein product [Ceratitis capitata]|uniref:(Mediterranean fruit fly) hypothetical protein n=1 Tax=Ceratitis capitata TaxID=7213 RepID=A0A811VBZ3_CERCA|nr:unnamed protein product [Ceratitis capitata]
MPVEPFKKEIYQRKVHLCNLNSGRGQVKRSRLMNNQIKESSTQSPHLTHSHLGIAEIAALHKQSSSRRTPAHRTNACSDNGGIDDDNLYFM